MNETRTSRVTDLVPYVHVVDVAKASAFLGELGLEVLDSYEVDGRLEWAWLGSSHARLMLARATAPILGEEQAVLFWLYTQDLDGLRSHLTEVGIDAGPIEESDVGPRRQMRLEDLDGYLLMVGEIEGDEVQAGH